MKLEVFTILKAISFSAIAIDRWRTGGPLWVSLDLVNGDSHETRLGHVAARSSATDSILRIALVALV